MIDRRELLSASAALCASAAAGGGQEPSERLPVLFVSHGAPDVALDPRRGAEWGDWAASLIPPRALLVVSAHWEATPLRLGTVETRPLLYDFGGFDPALRELRYAAPGAPRLAERVARLLGTEPTPTQRAWDHGVWVPLLHMFPRADVPVLQLSLPTRMPARELVELGARLAPLRDEGVLLIASGGLVHNLRHALTRGADPTPAWATDFEAWVRDTLARQDEDELVDYRRRAPGLRESHPSEEHFLPLLLAAGAAREPSLAPRAKVEGFERSSLSRLCLELG